MRSVPLADWYVTPYQKRLMRKILRSGRLTYGPMTQKLEKEFAKIHGAKYALFTNSGTSALKIAIHALKAKYGWKDGDEIIIPAVTFVATMNVVVMNNLKPVLVDIDPTTININPNAIKAAITKKTRAIIPVHLLGQPTSMSIIKEFAHSHNLKIIEDSCETMFVNKLEGDIACFSTYIAHLMTTGVGGFILTNDKQLAIEMRSIMFHGRDESYLSLEDNKKRGEKWEKMIKNRYYFPRSGYSDRATEMEAALGLGDLRNWKEMIQQRQDNARYYLENLKDISTLTFPINIIKKHAFMFFPMIVDNNRDKFMIYLEKNGIQSRTMLPLTNQPITKPYLKGNYPIASFINEHGILIGCHQYLTQEDLDYVIKKIKGFYND